MTVFIIAAALFGAVTGKIASAKGRVGLFWSLYGMFLFPVAFPHVLLMRPIRKCPFCARTLKGKYECARCGRELPIELTDAIVDADVRDTIGIGLGDSIGRSGRKLTRMGWEYLLDDSGDSGRVRCEPREIYGHDADVMMETAEGKISSVSVGYAVDPDFRIYYELRRTLVSKYGTPNYENFEMNYSDHWATKKFLVTLSTRRQDDEPSQYATVLVYMAIGKNISDAVGKSTGIVPGAE